MPSGKRGPVAVVRRKEVPRTLHNKEELTKGWVRSYTLSKAGGKLPPPFQGG